MSAVRAFDAATGRESGGIVVAGARAVLRRAVRGRLPEGTEWGEALLGEFEEAPTPIAAVWWTLSSLPLAWKERRRARSDPDAPKAPPRSLRVRVTRRFVATVVIVLVAGLLVNLFVATIVYESSSSMEPTIGIADRVLVDKVGFHLTGLHRGDVVLIDAPKLFAGQRGVLKRIVGLPGDVISCAGGNLYVNGVIEPDRRVGGESVPPATDCTSVTVPAGEVYILGDNQALSADSTEFGPISRSVVVGREVIKVWNG